MKNIKLQEPRMMVFAGAGASAGLGMPTTPQFINRLKQHWPNLEHLINVYKKYIIDSEEPIQGSVSIDSEYLRDWLAHMKQMAECIEKLSLHEPFETNISRTEYASKFVDALLTNFDSLIRKAYGYIPPEQAYKHYSPFLSILSKYNIDLLPFFTTNYDLVFECMKEYEGIDWYIETGMKETGKYVILDTKLFDKVSSNLPKLLIFKLHGSTDWWMNKDKGQIERVSLDYTPPANYKDLLIYPTREKFSQVSQEPFSFFYNRLEHYISSKKLRLCIVIGYSFRDKFVNEKFSNAIKKGLRLLIFDQNMKKAQLQEEFSKFHIDKSDVENKVRIEHIEFGNWSDQYREKVAQVLSEELGEDS